MDVKLPNLGEGADSGAVINVYVKEGDKIEKDQPVIELENEKAVATIPSTASGIVSKIHVKAGDKISAGQRIISVSESGGNAASTPAAATPAKVERAPTRQPSPPSSAEEPEHAEPEVPEDQATPSNGPIAAAPSVRRMADELGIDLAQVRGSQRGGRIVLSDVRAYIQRLTRGAQTKTSAAPSAEKAAPEKIDFSRWGAIYKKPMSSLRGVISRRMLENWNTIPHVTQFDDADLTQVLGLRKKYAQAYEKRGARLTVTSFVLKTVAATLKKHPIFNSSLDEAAGEIIFKEYFHIGIAVDTEAGLIVPVIRDVDKKSLVELSSELEELAKKARDRKISAEELKGGTFTISNQGGIGGGHFTPIVNKPEVAILGLGKGSLKPVAKNDKIELRMMLPVTVSYDHRVIDGGAAARFMVDLVQAIENFNEAEVKI